MGHSDLDRGLETTPPPVGREAWVTLAILCAIYACNMADRQILAILAPQVKNDLHLSDAQLGLLLGPAIAFLYAGLGVGLGHLADKVHRVRFLTGCLALWSVFTALGGFASNAWLLALSRVGVSAAEGGGIPASASLIADHFPPARRAIGSAVFASASSLGVFLSFAFGGLIGHEYGWRVALFAAGVPGIILAIITILVLREPVRGRLDSDAESKATGLSLFGKLKFLFSVPIFRTTLIGNALLNIGISTTLAWGPTLILRRFGGDLGSVGRYLGLGIALLGALCILTAGWAITRMGAGGFARALRLIGVLQISGVGFLLLALVSPSFGVAIFALSALYSVMHFYTPTPYVVAQNYLPVDFRATAMATGVLVLTLVGNATAPPLVGALSDLLRPRFGDASLGLAMLPIAPAIALSAYAYFRAARDIDRNRG